MNYDAIYQILSHYKVGTTAKELILKDCNIINTESNSHNVEYGSLIDLTSQVYVGNILTDNLPNSVNLSPLFAHTNPSGEYAVLHSHPSSASFSLQDLKVFLSTPELKLLFAIGNNSTVYILYKNKNIHRHLVNTYLTQYNNVSNTLRSKYQNLIYSKPSLKVDLVREYSHEILYHVCKGTILNYYRVKG